MKQINFLNNFQKHNSISSRKNILNIKNEAIRNLSKYVNNVNHNLSKKNIEIVRYNEELLQRQFFDTEVDIRSNDIITCISKINFQDIQEKIGEDLTFFLNEKKWKEYFEKNLEFLQKNLGENAKCVYSVIHFDESIPHLHTMFTLNKKQVKKAIYNEKDIDLKKIEKNLEMQFCRYCKKNNISKENFDKNNDKTFEEFKENFFNENRQKKIDFQLKKMNKNTSEKSFIYSNSINPNVNFRNFNEEFCKEMKENNIIIELKNNIEKALNEEVEIVKKFDKSLVKSQDLSNIKSEIKHNKNAVVKDFLKDMKDRKKREKLEDFFIKEELINDKLKKTEKDFDFRMKKVQDFLNNEDTFEADKFKQNRITLKHKIHNNILYFIEKNFKNNDFKKAKKFFKDFDKKFDKINKENLEILEAVETKVFNKSKDLDTLNLSINESTLNLNNLNEELKQTNDKINSNEIMLNNQKKLIENNEEKIKNQNKEINENINVRKNMKYIEKEAVKELKNDIKNNYNFIKQLEKEVREEYLQSKSFTENIKVNILDKKIEEQNKKLEQIINKKNIISEETETIKNNALAEAETIKNNALAEAELIKSNALKMINEEINRKEKERTEKEFELKQLNQIYDKRKEKVKNIEEKILKNSDTFEKEIENKIKENLNEEKLEDFELFCNFNKNLEKSIRKTESLSKNEAKQIIFDTYTETNETIEKKHFSFSQIFEKLFNYLKMNIEDFKSKTNQNNTHNLNRNISNLTKFSDRQ